MDLIGQKVLIYIDMNGRKERQRASRLHPQLREGIASVVRLTRAVNYTSLSITSVTLQAV